MRFYTNLHPYYCGLDLHARTRYVCIIDEKGDTVVHKEIKAGPDALLVFTTNQELAKVEWHIKKHAKQHRAANFNLLKNSTVFNENRFLAV